MTRSDQARLFLSRLPLLVIGGLVAPAAQVASAEPARLTLDRLVNPDTIVEKDGRTIEFALNGFQSFTTLRALFHHIDAEAGRWTFPTPSARQTFADDLLNRGIESRVVSMLDEKPLELLLTHTTGQLGKAVDAVPATNGTVLFEGEHWRVQRAEYRRAFLRVQARWKTSLNCWSAAPSIPARVLSNWYVIDEGITLFGASYDSTEHFWQAVKYHPDVRVADVVGLLEAMSPIDWNAWVASLIADQDVSFRQRYAIEFLRANLAAEHRAWFAEELKKAAPDASVPARRWQQRAVGMNGTVRFSPLHEKILWGDIADVCHLIYFFATHNGATAATADVAPLVEKLRALHFDAVYVAGYRTGRMGFISADFRELMLDIWKVKYLEVRRFGDVIRSIRGVKLDHFLNDGDSPDIPIPVYVRYLNRIRELARAQKHGSPGDPAPGGPAKPRTGTRH